MGILIKKQLFLTRFLFVAPSKIKISVFLIKLKNKTLVFNKSEGLIFIFCNIFKKIKFCKTLKIRTKICRK